VATLSIDTAEIQVFVLLLRAHASIVRGLDR